MIQITSWLEWCSLAVLKLSVEREQIDSQRSLPASPVDNTGCSLCERKQTDWGWAQNLCWWWRKSSCHSECVGGHGWVLHPHAPPIEHWSCTHCILGRPMAAASSHLQASQCLSILPTLPRLLLESRFAARAELWGNRRLAMPCLFSSPLGK